MWKTSTLILTIVFSLTTLAGKAQSDRTPPNQDGGSKVVKLYPNPATTTIYFEIQPQQHTNDRTYDLIVYNFLGKKMEQLKGISNRTPLNLDNYYSGLYIYQLRDQRGNLIESGKFNVVK